MGEAMLWRCIKAKALGCEFHRQVPVDNFILDFFCPERMLAIEIDGAGHDHPDAVVEDLRRQRALERLGIRFLRYQESEVREHLEGVVAHISDWLQADAHGANPTSP
jgi:very-short-patch-repair endonuclease